MDQQEIRALLEQVAQGQRSVDEAVLALKMEPFQEVDGTPVQAVFGPEDVTGYETYPSHDCPLCRSKNRLDALVNGYGYSKL